jgi:tetratricopeptide (TPR) repeat protein
VLAIVTTPLFSQLYNAEVINKKTRITASADKIITEESVRILSEGMKQFPESESIATCLGISYMNLGKYEEALKCYCKFPDSREVLQYTAACYRALGDFEKESSVLRRIGKLSYSDRI